MSSGLFLPVSDTVLRRPRGKASVNLEHGLLSIMRLISCVPQISPGRRNCTCVVKARVGRGAEGSHGGHRQSPIQEGYHSGEDTRLTRKGIPSVGS
jgi:hypothetical protein